MTKVNSKYSSDKGNYVNEFEKLNEADLDKIMNPGHVDEAKWKEAKAVSQKEYGEIKWPFVQYVYQKMKK